MVFIAIIVGVVCLIRCCCCTKDDDDEFDIGPLTLFTAPVAYERASLPSGGANENELPIIYLTTGIKTGAVLSGTERAALPAAIAADAAPAPFPPAVGASAPPFPTADVPTSLPPMGYH